MTRRCRKSAYLLYGRRVAPPLWSGAAGQRLAAVTICR
ncbi:hypothetical protein T261_01122 [Streptomyces lydicus]|nr:hypothetical protein T261_01122 [Streptomyces lydicus]